MEIRSSSAVMAGEKVGSEVVMGLGLEDWASASMRERAAARASGEGSGSMSDESVS